MNNRWPAIVLAAVLCVIPPYAAQCADSKEPAKSQDDYYELLKAFVDTLDQLERNYVKDLSRRELVEAAIEGMISKLDQHSDYIPPEELDRFKRGVENEFGGVGIEVTKEPGVLTIISPLVGSPAYRAGLSAGDVITHIEGEVTKPLSLLDAVRRMKGRLGTSVELTVRHPSDDTSRTVKLTRELVRVETVMGDRRNDDGSWQFLYDTEEKIGYVRVSAFARHTAGELRKAVRKLGQDGMRGLVLDLRYNPGGLLSSAIQLSDLFISEGRIVSTEGRNTEPQAWEAHRRGTFEDFPMAVLVNRFSASASEIVAACLQDHERAVIVGERTFGKGSVQNIIELENGRSALKLTTAGYKRPSGRNIHRFPGAAESEDWGVQPNEGWEVEISESERRMLWGQRRQRDIVNKVEEAEQEDPDLPDPVLAKGLSYVKGQLALELATQDSP